MHLQYEERRQAHFESENLVHREGLSVASQAAHPGVKVIHSRFDGCNESSQRAGRQIQKIWRTGGRSDPEGPIFSIECFACHGSRLKSGYDIKAGE